MPAPRFTEETVAPLKRVMLDRMATFKFTPSDVEALVEETGLLKCQVLKWQEKFRQRWAYRAQDTVVKFLKSVAEQVNLTTN